MIRRTLTRFLMLTLIAACGYNAWQVHQLRGQVQWLQSQVIRTRSDSGDTAASSTSPVRRDWLEQADLHAARAREAVLRADLPTAQRELERGADDVRRAVREPEAKTQTTLAQARHTLSVLQSQADTLWHKVQTTPPGH